MARKKKLSSRLYGAAFGLMSLARRVKDLEQIEHPKQLIQRHVKRAARLKVEGWLDRLFNRIFK
jgi:hypothetical protein